MGPPAGASAVPRSFLGATFPKAALAVVALLVPAAPAAPAEWYARSRLSLQTGYDSNIRLQPDDEKSAFVVTPSPQLLLGARTRNLDLKLDTRADFVRYLGESDLNSNNQYVEGTGTWTGQRSAFTLGGSFIRDTSTDDDTDESGQRNLGSERRVTGSIDPSFSYRLTPRQTLILSGSYERRIYPDAQGASQGVLEGTAFVGGGTVVASNGAIEDALTGQSGNRQNYDQLTGQMFWQYALTPRTVVGGGPSILYLSQPRQKLTQGSLQALVQHTLTPRLKIDARGGPSIVVTDSKLQESSSVLAIQTINGAPVLGTETTFFEESDSSTTLGYVADVGLTWLVTPRTDLALRFARSVAPSGSEGEAVNRDEASLRLDHDVTRTVGLFVLAAWLNQGNVSSKAGNNEGSDGDRTTIRFEPGVRWSLTPELDLSLRYRLRYREFDSTGDDATSNAVFLRLDLKLPDLRTSW